MPPLYRLIVSPNPYQMDAFVVGGKSFSALTIKNKDFVDGILKVDSNYKKDMGVFPPDPSTKKKKNPFDPLQPDDRYCGSAGYWFNEMQNGGNFGKCLAGAILSIDRVNSTHLEACVSGRDEIRKRILGRCPSANPVADLKNLLQTNFCSNGGSSHLLGCLTDAIQAKGKKTPRFNLSFATKFCFYASKWLNAGSEYSKYDNVVAEALPTYYDCYKGNKPGTTKKSAFKLQSKMNLQERIGVYAKYSECIGEILSKLKSSNIVLSREDFDEIVWYTNK